MNTISLDDKSADIQIWLDDALSRFDRDNSNSPPTTIGLYSCPRGGWIMLCIDTNGTTESAGEGCLEFNFVEYAEIELAEWKAIYRGGACQVRVESEEEDAGSVYDIDRKNDDDKTFDEPFFVFLVSFMKKYSFDGRRKPIWAGVEMQTGYHYDFWKV